MTEEETNQKKTFNKVKTFPIPLTSGELKNHNAKSDIINSKQVIINKAFKYHSQGNISKAAKFYKLFLDKGFNDPKVLSNYAAILKKEGKLEQARLLLNKAIQIKPDYATAHYNLGIVYMNLDKLKEAELSLIKAINYKPDYELAHYNLGLISISLNKLEQAELSLRKAIEYKQDFANIYYKLSQVLLALGKIKESEKEIRKGIELKPNCARINHLLSLILSSQKRYNESILEIKKTIEKDPKNHLYQGELTRLKFLLETGDQDNSLSEKLWCDKDDYFIENNNKDILLIIFGSDGRLDKKIPSFNFYNLLKKNKSFDKLFLRDVKRNYYMDGLNNTTENFHETINFIRDIISKKNYKQVFAVGSSSGGFAAILYGHILQLTKVIVFNPQTVLSQEKESKIKDFVFAKRAANELRQKNTSDNLYQKCLNLKNLIPFNTLVELNYSEYSQIDKNYAEFIKHTNCKLIGYESASHLLALELKECGKLENIILTSLKL